MTNRHDMHASGTFRVDAFTPFEPPLSTGPETGTPVALAKLEKHFTGSISGRSTTVFTYALDPVSNIGGYVAMDTFEGSLHRRAGTFAFMHSATTAGEERHEESFTIVPSSGTGELAGISGGGGISVDPDGTHHLWLDYGFADETSAAQMIVLNGGSSSGKSSIARALQERLPGIWLTFGVDAFIEALPGGGDSAKSGISYGRDGTVSVTEEYTRLETAWYAALHALARAGARIILDEVLLSGRAGQQRLLSAFDGLSMLWVGVHCDPDVAEAREAARGDRVPGMARLQARRVHDGVAYDIELDTTARSPDACAQLLADTLAGRPPA